ncbi:chaperonin 10-like protein [Neurospora tetraspora]|uniref:Chaperonin 10-like protein n=1 Tax=Neurospora tetraspora TaxID=94610 RepID=A0AAE0JGJ3_9PEZI|nr:chaperonin 10-like protein [Neurospora tetraspora]
MATAQLAYGVERIVGHGPEQIKQDISTYDPDKGTGDASQLMKALVWEGNKKVQVVEVPKPKIVEPTDVILKVTGSTICGSDLHLFHGAVMQMNKGDILGHEFCGIVDQVGPAVKKAQVGKRYVVSFQIACGDCFFCKNKLSSQCEVTNSNTQMKAMYGGRTAGIFGYSHLTGGFAGGQAEYVRVPLADVNMLEIPDDVPDEKALYLSDVLPTSYNAVKDTAVYPGDAVAIFGGGPVGQMVGVYALWEGASKVIYVDTEPRLSFVKSRWPAEHQDKLQLVDFKQLSYGITTKETVVSKLKELTGGRGPDVAIDCAAGEYAKGWLHWLEMQLGAETDTSEIINEMVEGVRNYGRVGLTGVYVGYTNHFNVGSLMQRGIRLIGNGQAPVHKYWEELLQKIRDGTLDPTIMLSHRVRLDDMDKVYHKFDAKEDAMQKVFVETKFSLPRAPGTPELTTYE